MNHLTLRAVTNRQLQRLQRNHRAAILSARRAVYSAEARAMAALRRQLSAESDNLTLDRDEIRPAPGIDRIEGR